MRRRRHVLPAGRGPVSSARWSSGSPTADRTPCGVREVDARDTAVQLGHRRLSIIDLSTASDQPFVKDGLRLSYNGELYNYRELRAELEGQGVRFVTQSDTEVVLEALRHWGTDALRRFRGMFAFALYDERQGTLLLARDPLGIKPLYVMPRGEGVIFASELKAIVTRRRGRADREPAGTRRLDAVLLRARGGDLARRRVQAARGVMGPRTSDGSSSGPHRYWDPADEARTAAQRPPADARRGDRGVGDGPPRRRRAGGVVPQRRPRLQPDHGDGGPARPLDRGLHHHLPPRGPAPGGHARRRGVRPQDGGAPGHQAARDRDQPRRRRHAAADRRRPRRAHR